MKKHFWALATAIICLLTVASCNKKEEIGELTMQYEEIPSLAIQNCNLTIADKSGASTLLEGVGIIIESKNRTATTCIYDKFNNEMMKFTDTDVALMTGNLEGEGYKQLMCILLVRTTSFNAPTDFTDDQIVAKIVPTSQTTWAMRYVRQFTQQK